MDRRYQRASLNIETREDGSHTLEGLAVTFSGPEDHNAHGEIVAPGAFKGTLEKVRAGDRTIIMLDNHGRAVGTWHFLQEQSAGLFVRGTILNTTEGRDLATLIRGGAVQGLSIGFDPTRSVGEDMDVLTRFGFPVKRMTDVDLREVSPTPFPSDEGARITAIRSARLACYQTSRADLEERSIAQVFALSAARLSIASMDTEARRLDAFLERCACREQKSSRQQDDDLDTRGDTLGGAMAAAIEAMITDDKSRADIVREVADALGLSPSAINQMIAGNINCGTEEQIATIASALGVSKSSLIAAAEADGCSFGDDDDE